MWLGLLPVAARAGRVFAAQATTRLRELEPTSKGRLGVALLDTADGVRATYRADERFPMCSTFKFLAVAAVLARVDAGLEQLDRRIPFGSADLLDYAPIRRAWPGSRRTDASFWRRKGIHASVVCGVTLAE